MHSIPPVIETQPRTRSLAERIFISPSETRLRAGWRLLGQFSMMLILLFFLSLIAGVFLILRGKGVDIISPCLQIPVLIAVTTSVFLSRRLLDHRSITSLGLKLNSLMVIDLLVGIFIAALMLGFTFLLESISGFVTINNYAWQNLPQNILWSSLASMLILFIIIGWQEELLSRGYWLQNIAVGLNITWGVIISSFFFAAFHLNNPNVFASVDSVLRVMLGLFLGGVFFCYAYLRTRQLWLPIGLHIGWNFFEGPVFGFQVSGMEFFRLIEQTVNGPPAITGGAFGPEAGLIILPAFVLGFVSVYLYSRLVHRSLRGVVAFLAREDLKE